MSRHPRFLCRCQLTLKLHLVLNNEGLALVVNLLGELGRDGVVSGGVLDDKTLVAVNSLVLVGLLNSPLANVGPFLFLLSLVGAASVLLGVRRLPSGLPVIGELLQEVRLDGGGLNDESLLAHSKSFTHAARAAVTAAAARASNLERERELGLQ